MAPAANSAPSSSDSVALSDDAAGVDEGARSGAPGGPAATDGVEAMTYEQARDALVGVVDQLERGGTTLEQSLALWERGEALAARCETWLIGARARLDAARGAASQNG